jgi:hypothetical protein
MAEIGYLTFNFLNKVFPPNLLFTGISLLTVFCLSSLVYVLICLIIRVEESKIILKMILKKLSICQKVERSKK